MPRYDSQERQLKCSRRKGNVPAEAWTMASSLFSSEMWPCAQEEFGVWRHWPAVHSSSVLSRLGKMRGNSSSQRPCCRRVSGKGLWPTKKPKKVPSWRGCGWRSYSTHYAREIQSEELMQWPQRERDQGRCFSQAQGSHSASFFWLPLCVFQWNRSKKLKNQLYMVKDPLKIREPVHEANQWQTISLLNKTRTAASQVLDLNVQSLTHPRNCTWTFRPLALEDGRLCEHMASDSSLLSLCCLRP